MSRSSRSAVVATVFAILAMVLGVTSYLLLDRARQAERSILAQAAQNERIQRERAEAIENLWEIRERINRDETLPFAALRQAMDDDLRQFGQQVPHATYPAALRELSHQLQQERTKLAAVTADMRKLQEEFETIEAIKRREMALAADSTEQARTELQRERVDFQRSLDVKDQELNAIMDRATTLAHRLQQESRDKERVREELLGEVTKLRLILEKARAPFTPAALTKQTPDGKIVRSSAATKSVWIGIGSKHGTVPQLTFSVQPARFTGNPYLKPKAKLEVIRIEGPDLCEARIIESKLTDPIVAGDEVYNPAWDPGRTIKFALGGVLDIDHDGRDDRAIVRNMIVKSGGKVVAEVGADGVVQGAVNVETNYYVRGAEPKVQEGLGAIKLAEAMAKMERAALDYGAIVIDLAKFLDLMGYAPNDRLVR